MENATQTLHRLTSYEPGREWTEPVDDPRVVRDLVVNDVERLPWFSKRYPDGLPRVPLSRSLPPVPEPALDVLAGAATEVPLDLGRVLFLSAGVVRTIERAYGTHPFRAAGSAGGRFPLEVYAVLPSGVHWYDPFDHALVRIGPPPSSPGGPTLVVTGVPWRTGWRYRERGFRHVYWDAGTMLSQVLAAAPGAALFTRFPDSQVTALVGADGVHEWPVAVVALDGGSPTLTPSGPAVAGAVDSAPLAFPLVTAAQRAGDSDLLGMPWDFGPAVPLALRTPDPVEQVILSRGSQRRMDPARGLTRDLLLTAMRVAVRGVDLPHFVAVHDVTGVEPGLYRWPDLTNPIRTGNLRAELYRVALDQALARDAAFVVITAASVASLDDHAYREAQLGAGLVEGRLHLAAYALAAGATGMTFLDSEIPALLGSPLDAMLLTCVGVPAYKSAEAGRPGAPRQVRGVMPQ